MDLATQEAARRLLNRAHQTFTEIDSGRLDVSADVRQWLESYDELAPKMSQGEPSDVSTEIDVSGS